MEEPKTGVGGKIDMIDWRRVREGCPQCRGRLHWNPASVWCLVCSWSMNWPTGQVREAANRDGVAQ